MNRIKAHLYFNGIKIIDRSEMSHWSGAFIKWLESLEFSHQPGYETLIFLIDELRSHSIPPSAAKQCDAFSQKILSGI
jgi:hypothetical protein